MCWAAIEQLVCDWPLLNALLNTASGATGASIHRAGSLAAGLCEGERAQAAGDYGVGLPKTCFVPGGDNNEVAEFHSGKPALR
jgi:hypothetical protein